MKKLVASILLCSLLLCSVFCGLSANAAFTDVDSAAWYAKAVGYVSDNGIMTGVGNGKFGPNTVFSRAMLAQVLYRLDGSPAVSAANRYTDVSDGAWYHKAVTWASEKGIMAGYGKGRFGPNDKITREQLSIVLYRYDCLDNKYDTRLLGLFRDGPQVSYWAKDGMAWAVSHGLMSGSGNKLMPQKGASRAEVALILMRYLEYDGAQVDVADESESYVRVQDGVAKFRYVGDVSNIKARIISGDKLTTYVLNNSQEFSYTFPYGVGSYDLVLYENTTGNKYKQVVKQNYVLDEVENDTSLVSYSSYYDGFDSLEHLVDSIWDDNLSAYDNVHGLYDWIVSNVKYDYDRMDDVQSGYMPDLEKALYDKKGLCLDYSSLLCTMCRYKDVPAQILVGYHDGTCHAWSEVVIGDDVIHIDATFGACWYVARDKFFDMGSSVYRDYSEDYRF